MKTLKHCDGPSCPCENRDYIADLEELLALSHRKRDQYREQAERLEKELEKESFYARKQKALRVKALAENAKLERVLQEIADSGQGDLYSMKIAKAALEGKQE